MSLDEAVVERASVSVAVEPGEPGRDLTSVASTEPVASAHSDDEAPVQRHVTLIMKATRLCNLRCEYCHDWRAGKDQTMSFASLAATIKAVLTEPGHARVTFVWHGGEPTLLGVAYYEKALLLQARYRQPGQEIRNVMQTNATRITPEWIDFWKLYSFGIGMSIDGPALIHNATRFYANGKGSWDDVARGLDMLKASDLGASVLMVVDRPVLEYGPRAVFDFFGEMGVANFGLLACKPDNLPDVTSCTPAEHYVSPTEFNRFMSEVWDIWLDHGDPAIRIRELSSLESKIVTGTSTECTLRGACVGDYFLVDPDATVSHCDLFVGDDAYTFGNLHTDSFAEIRSTEAAAAIQTRTSDEVDAMRACPEFEVCQGWCPHERYISSRHHAEHDDACCGLRGLIEHLKEHPAPADMHPSRPARPRAVTALEGNGDRRGAGGARGTPVLLTRSAASSSSGAGDTDRERVSQISSIEQRSSQ